jgi:hypothetical protein
MGPRIHRLDAGRAHIRFEADCKPAREFRTGVSLHGHTLHSKETVDNIFHSANKLAPLRWALRRGAAWYRAHYGVPFELSRLWWTPPLSAHQAWTLETRQIREHFGMNSLVSLSDHDDIEAPMTLQHREECRPMPVSVEWTVPFAGTYFHIGVHNLPAGKARALMADLASYTNGTPRLPLWEMLEKLTSYRDTLIIFNHANWDESGFGGEAHLNAVRRFAGLYKPFLHAFELNGTRSWTQNREIFQLAREFGKPLIGGGDRHGMEPNTILNLTNAATLSEFAEEVRGGYSEVLITKQYAEPYCLRILQSLEDVLGEQDDHVYGWKRWCDRAFYRCDDGVTRSLSQAWGDNPAAVRWLGHGIGLLRNPQFKSAYRMALARREEVAL